ncbi:MAG: hypothetical protein ACK56J_05840 [Planctomycetota bacterium]
MRMDGDSVAKLVAAIMGYFETLSAVAAKHQGGVGMAALTSIGCSLFRWSF